MKCVILAAGYATRLYPLTKDRPKPLLDVAGRSILDRILDNAERVGRIDEVIIVSNARFFGKFMDWRKGRTSGFQITVLDDGSTENENRLGAVADLGFAVETASLRDDCLVLAGDNLFDFELKDFIDFAKERRSDCITTHVLDDREKLKRTGVIEIDGDSRVISFEEKPKEPKSNFAVPPFYFYTGDTLPLVSDFLAEGNDPDAPGNFIPWLTDRKPVYAFRFAGKRYDIGNLETYRDAQEIFAGR